MDIIKKIRNEAKNNFLSNVEPLKMDLLKGTIWDTTSIDLKNKTLKAIHEGRLKKAEFEEINALTKAGYIVIKGKTLEEWQNYFCNILDKKNKKINLSRIDEFTLQQIFTKQDYGKLVAVICLANNKEKINEKTLLDKNHIFQRCKNINL